MGSCFEGLFKKDTMVQSKFKFDGQFKNYNFLKLWNRLHIPLHVGGWLQCSSPIAWPSLPLLKGNFYAFELRASHVQKQKLSSPSPPFSPFATTEQELMHHCIPFKCTQARTRELMRMISLAWGEWSPLDLMLLGPEVAGFCETETYPIWVWCPWD